MRLHRHSAVEEVVHQVNEELDFIQCQERGQNWRADYSFPTLGINKEKREIAGRPLNDVIDLAGVVTLNAGGFYRSLLVPSEERFELSEGFFCPSRCKAREILHWR